MFSTQFSLCFWYTPLGHVGQDRISRLAEEGLLDWLIRIKLPRHEPRLTDKAAMKAFSKATRAPTPSELIHSNIYRPINMKAHHWAIYLITLIDDYLRYSYVSLLSHHYEAPDVSKHFATEMELNWNRKLKLFELIEIHEYLLHIFKEYCEGKVYNNSLWFHTLHNKRYFRAQESGIAWHC